MNREIANAILPYVETLYDANQKVIELCGADAYFDLNDDARLLLDVIQDIPRLVPYSYDNDKKTLKCKSRDGLLEYSNEIKSLKKSYEAIICEHYDTLDTVRKIRNKYEHKMHDIELDGYISDSDYLPVFSFSVDDGKLSIDIYEIVSLMKDLNMLFKSLVDEIKTFCVDNKLQEYGAYKRISRFNFDDFNKIYDSTSILKSVGKIMKDY